MNPIEQHLIEDEKMTLEEFKKKRREATMPVKFPTKKTHRNDPCPCDSGRKYKHCCEL